MSGIETFYDGMSEHYHLIFQDWEASMRHQGRVIDSLLRSSAPSGPVLDCACGIGTQSLALAALGFEVDASDLSAAEAARAKREAVARGLQVRVRVDDMRRLESAPVAHYGAVLCMDNALPHLDSDEDIGSALRAMRSRLRPGGLLVLSQRDYGPLISERPPSMPPSFFADPDGRRIVFQVWDWHDDRRYTVHLHISRQIGPNWQDHHFVGNYRAIPVEETAALTASAGFADVRVLPPVDTGFYQPIVTGVRA
ncbi:class I SAM-dependent methyltransferase [Rhodopseudomonas palustris]|uniref:class I SAM-dependent methyltransferase n=1 Tax=Rhodopseudomonas palustris TaxID=1076 RepID=UPI0020CDFC34|nr:class I SAM-dependent methyltransferase [Rhodopseudomonas palustris]MCP9627677.1 class I SAM-dependent methyltransferase [Rhodopseudomonas palustris]